MRPLIVLLILGIGFASCGKSDPVSPDMLTGTWIEISARKDTIIFTAPSQSAGRLVGYLSVNRGREINAGGYVVPKLGSGLYLYTVEGKTINVRSMYSSNSEFANYTFERVGSQLRVGNFFELGFREPATATRTLVRL